MPYHQADIREQEMPRRAPRAEALLKLSTRLAKLHAIRLWRLVARRPAFQMSCSACGRGRDRLLLTGDPVTAASHSRAFGFCGSDGVEIFEPLSFKGRRGSGIAGGRCAYADRSLEPRRDWEKYRYTYRDVGTAAL